MLSFVFSMCIIFWFVSLVLGMFAISEMLDDYMFTEYENKEMVIFLIFPYIFVAKYRKQILGNIPKGIKWTVDMFRDFVKIVKHRKEK